MRLDNITDGKPTLSNWPVRIWDKSEIKPEYIPFLNDLFLEGLELQHLIFVPSFSYTCEYMLAIIPGKIRIISKSKSGYITAETILKEQILYITHVIELLYSRIDFHWYDGQNHRCSSVAFNRTTLDLFLPAVHTLLGLPYNFDCNEAESKCKRPDRLFNEDYALYQYSVNAYRMGEQINSYYRRFIKMPLIRRLKKHEPTRILSCPMERGLFIQVLDILFTGAFYFPWKFVSASSDYSSNESDKWEIKITDGIQRGTENIIASEVYRLSQKKNL